MKLRRGRVTSHVISYKKYSATIEVAYTLKIDNKSIKNHNEKNVGCYNGTENITKKLLHITAK